MKLGTIDLMWWIDEVLRETDSYDHPDVDSNPTPHIPGVRIWTKNGNVHVLRLNSAQMQAIMNALSYTLECSRVRPSCQYNVAKGFDVIDCGKPPNSRMQYLNLRKHRAGQEQGLKTTMSA
jgi:hypothetical protein